MEKLYLKVYQDKNNIDVFFVEKTENLGVLFLAEKAEMMENTDYLPFVFEPRIMREEEFEKLPEFTGF